MMVVGEYGSVDIESQEHGTAVAFFHSHHPRDPSNPMPIGDTEQWSFDDMQTGNRFYHEYSGIKGYLLTPEYFVKRYTYVSDSSYYLATIGSFNKEQGLCFEDKYNQNKNIKDELYSY